MTTDELVAGFRMVFDTDPVKARIESAGIVDSSSGGLTRLDIRQG